jgi:hypothetical protein
LLHIDDSFRKDYERQLSLFEQAGIPATPTGTAPMNNHLARTSFFAPIKRGKRPFRERTPLVSQQDARILVTGHQLDMADQNVLLKVYENASGIKPIDSQAITDIVPATKSDGSVQDPAKNTRVVINRARFLESIKMTRTGPNYEWLHKSLLRLAGNIIEIETSDLITTFQLINPPNLCKNTGTYFVSIPPSAASYFLNSSYGYIDWDVRLSLQVRPELGSWIESFVASHRREELHFIELKKLQALCGASSPLHKWRKYFLEAVEELEKKGLFEFLKLDEKDIFSFKAKKIHGTNQVL